VRPPQGLRERNWTSPYYNSAAEPWKVEMFQDAGRFLLPSWPGFRALVTKADGSQARPPRAPRPAPDSRQAAPAAANRAAAHGSAHMVVSI